MPLNYFSLVVIAISFFCFWGGLENGAFKLHEPGKPSDSITGIYRQYFIKQREIKRDRKSGIEYSDPLPTPDTLAVHSLFIEKNGQFVEMSKSCHPTFEEKQKGSYLKQTGRWDFRNDTLSLNYASETLYDDFSQKKVIRTGSYSKINEFLIKYVLVDGNRLWLAGDPYSTVNLLRE